MAIDLSGLSGTDASMLGPLMAMFIGMLVIIIPLMIALWIYMSLAFTAIGKKAKLSSPGIAWIPGLGPLINSFRISKMHWWPWLLFIGFIIPIVNIVCMLIFGVYSFIWMWKTFEAINKPGWWVLISLGGVIPYAGVLFSIAYLVLIGIAAWSKK